MNKLTHDTQTIKALLLSVGAVLLIFLWQGRVGFSLWDEGFLWYGVQRVMLGEVPLRDFMSYDPGRYYWSAAFANLWGDDGIVAVRVATAIFQAIGLVIGLRMLARQHSKTNLALLSMATLTLAVWMFPRHKLFDISASIMLIGALVALVEQQTLRRYFLAGLVVGVVAIFGRNHGVYGVLGSIGVMGYLAIRREEGAPGLIKGFAAWGAGVVIGYLPMLAFIVFIPGFASAFWESVFFVLEIKTVALPVPVPWPWQVPFGSLSLVEAIRGALVGLCFIGVAAYGVLGIVWAIRRRVQNKPAEPLLVASSFMALPYAHEAFARADIAHLAQGMFPLLIGLLALIAVRQGRTKWILAGLLCGSSLLVMLPRHPGWQCLTTQRCMEVEVAGDRLKVARGTAGDLAMLNKLAEQFSPNGRSFIAVPFWPGAYAALERKSPIWEIYPLLPRSDAFQQAEIERIKAADPGFAVIIDRALDNREELRFRNTHPMIERYVHDNFQPLEGYSQNPEYRIYVKKQVMQ